MIAKTAVLSAIVALSTAYPLFKQCDSRWGSNQIGTSSKTICQVGCLMSSMSMVLNDCHKTLDGGAAANPGTFNTWLKGHGGYVSGNLYVWGAVQPLGLSFVGFSSSDADIKSHFDQGHAVILNVNKGGHYVLMTGHSASGYSVNDPGFNKSSYTNAEVVKAGIYKRPSGCSTAQLATVEEPYDLE